MQADEIKLLDPTGEWGHVFGHHPFNIELAKAEGIWLEDIHGDRFIDASGGPMAVNLGHSDPRIGEAVRAQFERFAYCHPMLANRPRADLANAIVKHTPKNLSAVYLVSGGGGSRRDCFEACPTVLGLRRQTRQVQNGKLL